MKDAGLKELLFKHYWAQGCFVQPEVEIHFQEGVDGTTKPLTDVDVMILRPHPDFHYDRILGDCKTLKGVSPASRVLWLRGLMDLLGATTGCLLLGHGSRIERDHRLTANHLPINLLNSQEFSIYDRTIIFPHGSEHVDMSPEHVYRLKGLPGRFPKLSRVTHYFYRDAWRENGPADLIRHSLAILMQTSSEFDPAKVEHVALICDAAAIFSIGVAEIAGKIFQQYLQPEDKNTLSESLKVILWGGREAYNHYVNLRKKITQLQGATMAEYNETLELPKWNLFVQLIRNSLEYPGSSFAVPNLLRRMSSDILLKKHILLDVAPSNLLSLKYAMLTVGYFCAAGELPHEFEKYLVGELVAVQSRLVTDARKDAEETHPGAGGKSS